MYGTACMTLACAERRADLRPQLKLGLRECPHLQLLAPHIAPWRREQDELQRLPFLLRPAVDVDLPDEPPPPHLDRVQRGSVLRILPRLPQVGVPVVDER